METQMQPKRDLVSKRFFIEIFKVVDSKSPNQPSKFSTFSRAKKSGLVHGFEHQGLSSLKEHSFFFKLAK